MTIAKATVTGTVYRAPEKRFTSNNLAVSAFVLNIDEKDETLIRVISKRNVLDEVVSSLQKGDKILVDGRLQTASVKSEDGTERKVYEIDATTIEKMNGSNAPIQSANQSDEEIVKFDDAKFEDELIAEDEIPF